MTAFTFSFTVCSLVNEKHLLYDLKLSRLLNSVTSRAFSRVRWLHEETNVWWNHLYFAVKGYATLYRSYLELFFETVNSYVTR